MLLKVVIYSTKGRRCSEENLHSSSFFHLKITTTVRVKWRKGGKEYGEGEKEGRVRRGDGGRDW